MGSNSKTEKVHGPPIKMQLIATSCIRLFETVTELRMRSRYATYDEGDVCSDAQLF